jgi:hypothetical protein
MSFCENHDESSEFEGMYYLSSLMNRIFCEEKKRKIIMKNGDVCQVAEEFLKTELTTLCHLCKFYYTLSMVYQCFYIYLLIFINIGTNILI